MHQNLLTVNSFLVYWREKIDLHFMDKFMTQKKLEKVERLESAGQWDQYFQSGWEENDGRIQTRLFAESFEKNFHRIPFSCRSVLDCSCALGDSIPVLRRTFPEAELFGFDFSKVAIDLCNERFSKLAIFSVKK